MTSPLIIDCFVFNDEIDLFNLRVNELDDVVDYFIVVTLFTLGKISLKNHLFQI